MELVFYFREPCDLCATMRKALIAFQRNHPQITWREIDIDRDAELIRRYDTRVPVLCHGETEICHFFFDEPALLAALALA